MKGLKVKNLAEAKKYLRKVKFSTSIPITPIEKRVAKLEHNQEQLEKRLNGMMTQLLKDGVLRFVK